MRKIEFYYVEVMNETEQFMVFTTTFDKKELGKDLVLNTALPPAIQDIQIRRTIALLEHVTRKKLEAGK